MASGEYLSCMDQHLVVCVHNDAVVITFGAISFKFQIGSFRISKHRPQQNYVVSESQTRTRKEDQLHRGIFSSDISSEAVVIAAAPTPLYSKCRHRLYAAFFFSSCASCACERIELRSSSRGSLVQSKLM